MSRKKVDAIERHVALENIEDLMHTYCEGCLVRSTFRKEKGRKRAHRFCIETCTVGQQLQMTGKQLKIASKKG
ncbi:zinc-finger domain-containing protein [Bacillus fonticola]|uniref:zinc-finger domain-containing protein n=1 Tax=Bacillus fonticola TaxID=2728853 RepID=UPI0014759716|nr:zinc-finger domain-containing protein [Bacillus fonticola]